MNRFTGTLKFWNAERHFGFIVNDAGGDDFVHGSQLAASQINTATLEDGRTRLTYDTEERDSGRSHAVNLTIIEA